MAILDKGWICFVYLQMRTTHGPS